MTILSARTGFFLSIFMLAGSVAAGCSGRDEAGGRPNDGVGQGDDSGFGSSAGSFGGRDAGTTSGTTAGTTSGTTAGSTDGSTAGSTAGTTSGATSGSTDGSTTGSATSGSNGGSTFVTNTPGARFEDTSAEGSKLRITSSNLQQMSGSGSSLLQWLAEVVNDGQTPQCFTLAKLTALDAAGVELATVNGVVITPPWRALADRGADLCLGPGERGVAWANRSGDLVDLAAVATIRTTFTGLGIASAVPHPAAPKLASPVVGTGMGTEQTLTSTLTATEDIHGIKIRAFGYSAEGLIVDQALAENRAALRAGETWPYTVPFLWSRRQGRVTRVAQFPAFAVGLEQALQRGGERALAPNVGASTPERGAREEAARALAAVEARRRVAER